MSIFIGGAWPYANGSLHLGHLAALLPGDILARYYRLKGEKVLYVSGSDCHGTPIAIRASEEGITPKDITDKYHKEFSECFKALGFSYDLYTRTDNPFHHQVVKDTLLKLLDNGFIYKKVVEQIFCEHCNQFLPDRYVEGECPHCGNPARGDQCDYCSTVLDPIDLKNRKCKICGSTPTVKKTEHLYFALSKFQKELESFINDSSHWRENALNLSHRYLKEGLQDRAVTRDLSWGIEVPLEGYETKRIYVWIDAVLGYLSASQQLSESSNINWRNFWESDNVTSYYVHGKDNIPFHSLILTALLKGAGNLHLPNRIVSSEYLTIEGKKLSTSRNWAVWVPYIIEKYNPDSIRYFLTINGPEKRDCDFSWREFINSHNSELLGAYGNFINRTITFIHKFFNSTVPNGKIDTVIKSELKNLYKNAGKKIEDAEFKSALEDIFAFIRKSNKYFDSNQPWITVKNDINKCSNTIYTCTQIIANLSILLSPFIPFSSDKVKNFINIGNTSWSYLEVPPNHPIAPSEVLFERIDKKQIDVEVAKLMNQ